MKEMEKKEKKEERGLAAWVRAEAPSDPLRSGSRGSPCSSSGMAEAMPWLFSAGVPSGPSAVAGSQGSSLGGGCAGQRRGSCAMHRPALPSQAFPTRSASQAKTRSALLFCQAPAPESALHTHRAPGGSPPLGAERVGDPHAHPTGSTSPAPCRQLPVFTESYRAKAGCLQRVRVNVPPKSTGRSVGTLQTNPAK